LAVLYFLPYLIDRLVHPRTDAAGWLKSLTFPTAVTAVMYLASIEGPFDGATAKTIYAFGPLVYMQLLSLAGLWGFVFMASWFASVVNHAWEHGFRWYMTRGAASTFVAVLLAIVIFGAVKTSSLVRPESMPVKVAVVVIPPQEGREPSLLRTFAARRVTPMEQVRAEIGGLTHAAAERGAKIVVFQEYAAIVPQADVAVFHETLAGIAAANRVYLNVTYGMLAAEGKGKNKSLLIDDRGATRIDYQKRFLFGVAGFGETAFFAKGPGRLEAVDTPYGRVVVSTCRDADFPAYIQQAGAMGADIMLNPSWDYPKSFGPEYGLRAVENGFTMVRPVQNGLSYVMDFDGRLLASMDSDATQDGILLVDIPTKGVRTLYARVGDLSGWLAVAGLLAFVAVAVRRRPERHAEAGSRTGPA
jgi:apolipoprotein N-acyltransferase